MADITVSSKNKLCIYVLQCFARVGLHHEGLKLQYLVANLIKRPPAVLNLISIPTTQLGVYLEYYRHLKLIKTFKVSTNLQKHVIVNHCVMTKLL